LKGTVIRRLIAGWGGFDRENVFIVRRNMTRNTLATTKKSMRH
jgi:hypothetical protein